MDYLSKLSKSDEKKPVSQHPNNPDHNRKPSKSDLLHSAKVVSEAAQSHFRHEPEKYDKSQLAGATADLLNAAADYGKLDDNKGIGKYVDKAEDYLRQYHTSHPAGKPGDHKPSNTGGSGEHLGGGGGYGDEGRKGKKPSQGGQGHGSGDFLKMAGDFLKK